MSISCNMLLLHVVQSCEIATISALVAVKCELFVLLHHITYCDREINLICSHVTATVTAILKWKRIHCSNLDDHHACYTIYRCYSWCKKEISLLFLLLWLEMLLYFTVKGWNCITFTDDMTICSHNPPKRSCIWPTLNDRVKYI